MRYFPDTESDMRDAREMGAEPWMLELLKLGASYKSWGNFEDYMWNKNEGWDGAAEIGSFAEMWDLDDLNELVNFYFEVTRASRECDYCGGSGLNPATRHLNDTWYQHLCPPGQRAWSSELTDVEVQALWDGERLRYDSRPDAATVNRDYATGMGHDSINRWICVKARAQHQGVYGECEHCKGSGSIYTEPAPHVALQLWMLHPRKGCSRGLYVKRVERSDLPAIFAVLKEADERSRARFASLTDETLNALMTDAPHQDNPG